MNTNIKHKIFSSFVLFVLTLSLLYPSSVVLADDTTPPPAETQEPSPPAEETEDPVVPSSETEEPLEEGGPVEAEETESPQEPVETEAPAEGGDPAEADSTEVPTEAAAPEEGDEDPVEDPAAPEEASQSESLAEVLEQLPEGTDVVVLDEEGEVVPLVTEEAAAVIATSDPMWCPDGVSPGGAGCTDSYTSLTDLLNALSGDNQPAQDGTIWIENTYDSSTAEPVGTSSIVIDGDVYTTWSGYSLTIQGGWDIATNTIDGVSTFYIPFSILDWENTVTINNLLITGTSGTGLTVTANSSVTLNEVTSSGNADDGANLSTNIPGNPHINDVTVNDSTFNDNGGNGLTIDTKGNAYVNKVTASGNDGNGIQLSMQTGQRDAIISCGILAGNGGYGLVADLKSSDALSLDGVYFNGNTLGTYQSNVKPLVSSVDCADLYCEEGEGWDPAQGGCVCNDKDGDGVCDGVDICPLGDDNIDTDNDGIPDACDTCADIDGDGVCDDTDNCVGTYNPGQEDADGDGIGDACDDCLDMDQDGICDGQDNCPLVANPGQEDADGDGIGDACDDCLDVDQDNVCDDEDNCPLVANPDQTDTDGDGIGDACDDCLDVDQDEVCDDVDNCPTTYNPDQLDTDEDGFGDACDDCAAGDADQDGVCDDTDNCTQVPNPQQEDADNDGVGDACDDCVLGDGDGDGVCDDTDNCLAVANPEQEDMDNDGIGDACDDCLDVDQDGICDGEDNCPENFNPNQEDTDQDGIGDACDECLDVDQDEVCDDVDNCPSTFNPDQLDTDEDGFGDACDNCAAGDADQDGVCDDTDNCATYNPDQLDTDEDGVGDACDDCVTGDGDGDGVCDDTDNCLAVANPDQADSDGDGIGDACEEPISCPLGLVLVGNVCVPPDEPPATPEGSDPVIPVTGLCDPFSVEEIFYDEDLEILVILNNLCFYNIDLDIVPADIPVEIEHFSGLETAITLLVDGSVVNQMPPGTSMQMLFEIPAELATPEELPKHEFVVMYWDPFANNAKGAWVELETVVENGQAVVLLSPGSPVFFPASFVLVDKTEIEGAQSPSALAWVSELYVSVTQWFESMVW